MLAVGDVGKCQIEPTSSGDQSIHKYNQEMVDYWESFFCVPYCEDSTDVKDARPGMWAQRE